MKKINILKFKIAKINMKMILKLKNKEITILQVLNKYEYLYFLISIS